MQRIATLGLFAFAVTVGNAQPLLDPTFATNGYTQDNNLRGPVTSLAIRPDGMIIGGLDQRSYQNWQTGYVRMTAYHPDGTQNTAFGQSGVCSVYGYGEASVVNDVAALPDNKSLFIGHAEYCVELVCGLPNFLLGRVKVDGTPDSTFGVNGVVRSNELFGPQV